MNSEESCCSNQSLKGVEHTGVIDMMSHDAASNVVTMVMIEPRPWDGSELQMFQLQEKFNAYLSFALDGEMADAYPVLVDKPLRIELRCVAPPPEPVLGFLQHVHDQIAFQGIELLVRVLGGGGGCGQGCGCASGENEAP